PTCFFGLNLDQAELVSLQTLRGFADLGIRPIPYRKDHGVALDCELRVFLRHRLAAARIVRGPEFHSNQLHTCDVSFTVAQEPSWRSQVVEDHALFEGV